MIFRLEKLRIMWVQRKRCLVDTSTQIAVKIRWVSIESPLKLPIIKFAKKKNCSLEDIWQSRSAINSILIAGKNFPHKLQKHFGTSRYIFPDFFLHYSLKFKFYNMIKKYNFYVLSVHPNALNYPLVWLGNLLERNLWLMKVSNGNLNY